MTQTAMLTTNSTDGVPPLTPGQFRLLFPALDDAPHFASCSQGAVSDHLAHAMQGFVGMLSETQAPWGTWVGQVEHYRRLAGSTIGADPEHVAVLSCASEAAFQVVSSLDWSGERNRLVTSDHEFPSIGNVWRAQRENIDVVSVHGHEAVVSAESWTAVIDERTKLVSIPLVSYVNGARPEVEAIIAHAHSVGAKVSIDAFQGAGVVPIDVGALDCDFLFTGNLKYLLGLPGVAMLYVKDVVPELPARLTGWFGRVDPFAFDAAVVDYPENARAFETGTHPVPSVYAGVAGMELLARIDRQEAWSHVARLRDRLAEGLTEIGLTVDLPRDAAHRGPQVAIVDESPDALAAELSNRFRIGSAPRGQRLRLSLHAYSNERDLETLFAALREVRG